jgi:uncharacterized protein (DUF58 family)
MITSEMYSLIHQLELMTKKMISGPLLGDWHSSSKGSGFEFHQLREYIQGDDIRYIDWKASARTDKMLVRQYLEDRNKLIYIVVDISGSTAYGTGSQSKSDLMRQLAAVLAFVGHHKKDSVGLILFSQSNELVIPPSTSRTHLLALIQKLLAYKAKERATNMNAPIDYLARLAGKRALICFISDFTAPFDTSMLAVIARKHDVMAFRCLDEREWQFPACGTLIFEDRETGQQQEIEKTDVVQEALVQWHRRQKELLAAAKIDCLDLTAGKPYAGQLVKFLRQRLFD